MGAFPNTRMIALGWVLSFSFLLGTCRSLSTTAPVSKPTTPAAATSTEEHGPPTHYKWLIVGGGIHGVGIAARLVGEGRIGQKQKQQQLLLVDEHPSPLYSWKKRTRATGMAFLRSSAGFHLDVPAQGLRRFAGEYNGIKGEPATATKRTRAVAKKKRPSKKDKRKTKNNQNKETTDDGTLVGKDYQRPALELFNDHCDLVVEKYGLGGCYFRGRVESIGSSGSGKASPSRVVIRTGSDATETAVTADNIVLAVGNDDPMYPEWTQDLLSSSEEESRGGHENHPRISHLLQLSDGIDGASSASNSSNNNNNDETVEEQQHQQVVAIIGGGISAVHKALQLTSADSNKKVHIISRHEVREQQFDTHQDWMMTKELAARSTEKGGKGLNDRLKKFETIESVGERRKVILRERIPGTIPTYMTRARGGLEDAIREGKIRWHVADVATAEEHNDNDSNDNGNDPVKNGFRLELTSGDSISVDRIVLATGLGKRPPGHAIIHPLAEEAGLPLSPCGYPIVDESLLWRQKASDGNNDPSASSSSSSSNIFVSGGLAELELGPSARNIAGARMAAERIAAAASELR